MKICLLYKNKTYIVTYDDEGILDTVEHQSKLMSSNNRIVKIILNNADNIYKSILPKGFERV